MPTKGSSDMVQAMSFMEEFICADLNELHLQRRVLTTVLLLGLYKGEVGRTYRFLCICCLNTGVLLWEHKLYLRWFLSLGVWVMSWVSCWPELESYCLSFPPPIHQIQTAFLFGCESEMVWRETHVFFDQRYYFCCLTCNIQRPFSDGELGNVLSFPYWYMDYGKKPDLESDISMFIL